LNARKIAVVCRRLSLELFSVHEVRGSRGPMYAIGCFQNIDDGQPGNYHIILRISCSTFGSCRYNSSVFLNEMPQGDQLKSACTGTVLCVVKAGMGPALSNNPARFHSTKRPGLVTLWQNTSFGFTSPNNPCSSSLPNTAIQSFGSTGCRTYGCRTESDFGQAHPNKQY
jgi:hypothetical protein